MYIMLWIDVSVIDVHEDDGEPSENFLREVQNYFEQQKTKHPANRNTRQTCTCTSEGELIIPSGLHVSLSVCVMCTCCRLKLHCNKYMLIGTHYLICLLYTSDAADE